MVGFHYFWSEVPPASSSNTHTRTHTCSHMHVHILAQPHTCILVVYVALCTGRLSNQEEEPFTKMQPHKPDILQ